ANILHPGFLWLIRDALAFNKETRADRAAGTVNPAETLSHYLDRKNYSDYCRRYSIIPMGAAIWSASEAMMMDFPLYFLLQFFNNHGMLSVDDRPHWRVVSLGSRSYEERLKQDLPHSQIYQNTPVTRDDPRPNITSW